MERLRTAFLISGQGSTMAAVIDACRSERLPGIEPVVVIASTPVAGGIEKARARNVLVEMRVRKEYESSEAFGEALLKTLDAYRVDFVSQNGWLPLTPVTVVDAYQDKIINQHPGPLDPGWPDFGGKDMYGRRVVCARIAFLWAAGGFQWTESTIHTVTSEYDQGTIVSVWKQYLGPRRNPLPFSQIQQEKDVLRASVEHASKEFIRLEHENVIFTLGALAVGHLPVISRNQRLITENQRDLLNQAKRLAIELYPEG